MKFLVVTPLSIYHFDPDGNDSTMVPYMSSVATSLQKSQHEVKTLLNKEAKFYAKV